MVLGLEVEVTTDSTDPMYTLHRAYCFIADLEMSWVVAAPEMILPYKASISRCVTFRLDTSRGGIK